MFEIGVLDGRPRTPAPAEPMPPFRPPERFNLADHFLRDRIREGRGGRTALHCDGGPLTYLEVERLANRYGNLLLEAGVEPEQRVLIALPDGPEFVAALFGTLRIGAVAVMANPHLRVEAAEHLLEYTRAKVSITHGATDQAFREAAAGPAARELAERFVFGAGAEAEALRCSDDLETCPTHRDDPAIWLFSGGTTGRPKAVVQPHASFANSTECYAKGVLGLEEDDITISVPKLYFGYATGSNLLFPFAVGASAVLFADRCTPEVLFDRIRRFRPTVLVNVPTMVGRMVAAVEGAGPAPDLSSLRLATSAGEALPVELHRRWTETFGVELLDGLGTAEMWHVFISNRPGRVRPGTLGESVPGFEVRVTDDEGRTLPDGEVGHLRVRGDSRAIQYWRRMDLTREAFQGAWYLSGDMISRSEDGFFTYHGRGDDMLKVRGKWFAPGEVENRLLEHPDVREAAVVGARTSDGLVEPRAFVVVREGVESSPAELSDALRAFLLEGLESHKVPARFGFPEALPRTHLGKVDRAALRAAPAPGDVRNL